MNPSSDLISLDDALERILSDIEAITMTEETCLTQACDRVCAETIHAKITQPPFNNSAVDGYAFRIADLEKHNALPVSQRIVAGDAPIRLNEGVAARIFTGAPVPDEADCVIMQEDTHVENACMQVTTPITLLHANQNIRPAGQDFKIGQPLVKTGEVISPQRIALLASSGVPKVKVYRPLNIAILTTGDELVEPGHSLQPGQIYNSNSYLLSTLLAQLGMKVSSIQHAKDSLEETLEAMKQAAKADIVITCGGASVGEEDYIKNAIEELGSVHFWRIALKPGKPFMYGNILNRPILGLPGNPGAVLVTFLALARPVLLKLQGVQNIKPKSMRLPLEHAIKQSGKRREFLRVRVTEEGTLARHPNQSSGMLSSACWAEGLAVIPEHTAPKTGDRVEFYPFTELTRLPQSTLELE